MTLVCVRLAAAVLAVATLALDGARAQAPASASVDLGETSVGPALRELREGVPYVRWTMTPFNDDFAASPLNLYPGFSEPLAKPELARTTGVMERKPMTVFQSVAVTVVPRPLASLNLAQFARLETLQALDPAVNYARLEPADVQLINQPNLAQVVPSPSRPWCSGGTTCVRARFSMPSLELNLFRIAARIEQRRADIEQLEAKGEIRYSSVSASDERARALSGLTGLPIQTANVVEQAYPYINAPGTRFVRIFLIAQAHPSDPNKTVVTGHFVFVMSTKLVNMNLGLITVRNYLLSRAGQANRGDGITMGLPRYSRSMAEKIVAQLMR